MHPTTGDEYALARTERKVGVGYHGFEVFYDPSVKLEDDLQRRDLTINSMAMDPETGEIIDPFGGRDDLKQSILRHTSDAFADDPLRVLRAARFAARYNFTVHPDTIKLGSKLVDELVHLTMERIWTELYKGFGEMNSHRMLRVLSDVGALQADPLKKYFGDLSQYSIFLEFAKTNDADVNAVLSMRNIAKLDDKALQKMKVPSHVSDAARLADKMLTLLTSDRMTPDQVHDFLKTIRHDTRTPTYSLAYNVSRIMASMKLKDDLFLRNLSIMLIANDDVRALDMAAIVAGVKDKTMVKHVVDNAKFEAVRRSMT